MLWEVIHDALATDRTVVSSSIVRADSADEAVRKFDAWLDDKRGTSYVYDHMSYGKRAYPVSVIE
jgi:hypothetical protein